jgi:hypothetical protein
MVEYKGGSCGLCGYDRCLRALDFHHLDPARKGFTLAGSHLRSWKALRAELDMCILVCSNCHAELEHDRRAANGHRVGYRSSVDNHEDAHVCVVCGRRYLYRPRKGMTRSRCNTCCQNRATAEQRHALKRWMVELSGGCCRLCGYKGSTHALTFHHVDPSLKRFNFSGNHNRSRELLESELAKCVLLCGNCHDELEAGVVDLPPGLVGIVQKATVALARLPRRRPGRPRADEIADAR